MPELAVWFSGLLPLWWMTLDFWSFSLLHLAEQASFHALYLQSTYCVNDPFWSVIYSTSPTLAPQLKILILSKLYRVVTISQVSFWFERCWVLFYLMYWGWGNAHQIFFFTVPLFSKFGTYILFIGLFCIKWVGLTVFFIFQTPQVQYKALQIIWNVFFCILMMYIFRCVVSSRFPKSFLYSSKLGKDVLSYSFFFWWWWRGIWAWKVYSNKTFPLTPQFYLAFEMYIILKCNDKMYSVVRSMNTAHFM